LQFLFIDMVAILNDSSIYVRLVTLFLCIYKCIGNYREQDMALGSCPPIASALVNFTVSLFHNLPNEKKG